MPACASPGRCVVPRSGRRRVWDDDLKLHAEAETLRLAKLSMLQFGLERNRVAEELDIPLWLLDRAVAAERSKLGNGNHNGHRQPLTLDDVEPWPMPVDGVALLDELSRTCRRYVVMSEAASDAVALWIVHTFVFTVAMITPRLAIKSAQKRSGKTTLLMVIGALAARTLSSANISAASVFRTVELCRPTLLIDEADTFVAENDELRGILNAGYMRGGQVVRTVGDNHEPAVFSCWCPVAIAAIRRLPDTIEDRSVAILLKRRRRDEEVTRLRADRLSELAPLARKARRWSLDNMNCLERADPPMPNQLNDRAADCWRVLISIADIAGGSWPQRAIRAALALSGDNDDTQTVGEKLLADLYTLFNKEPRPDVLFSEEIASALGAMEDRPWPEWGKRRLPITKVQVARVLDVFKINPKDVRRGSSHAKGYEREQFKEAFERYLAPIPEEFET
jgi:putative DNA primase/helicase